MKRERKRVFKLSDCVVTYERKGDVQSRIIVCTDGAEFHDVTLLTPLSIENPAFNAR